MVVEELKKEGGGAAGGEDFICGCCASLAALRFY
jgi:hypothetical protein